MTCVQKFKGLLFHWSFLAVLKAAEQWDEREGSALSGLKSTSSPRPPLFRSICVNIATPFTNVVRITPTKPSAPLV